MLQRGRQTAARVDSSAQAWAASSAHVQILGAKNYVNPLKLAASGTGIKSSI